MTAKTSLNIKKNVDSGVTASSIHRLSNFIANEFHPEKIILFGSHAYGHPHSQSDVDLLVIMPFDGSPFRQAGIVLNQVVKVLGVMPLDLLVRTSDQINDRLSIGDSFIQEIIKRGRVLYEADHANRSMSQRLFENLVMELAPEERNVYRNESDNSQAP